MMLEPTAVIAPLAAFASAVLLSSLAEYWVHRLMHLSKVKAVVHREHHRRNSAQGVLGEFGDYFRGAVPVAVAVAVPLAVWFSPATAAAWMCGALVYGGFAAFAHQLQHENPVRCFWLPMPVHYTHHKYNMWKHNFGIGVDWWDRLFGTYKAVEWSGEAEKAAAARRWHQLRWR